ncbi:citrate/2-methylcitrate synthase [Kallotenue papyrolyticum]|uniref:citrate/2-methylcitrate synthase n=1 Tax=Kallotenue papyrolyticum TaxID=1325125 RepID=UPI000492A816|nr:citrate synthase [Kallotenue papyrolyticum]
MTNTAVDATPAEKGLEGIIASKTAISLVDGQNGRLFYQGVEINDLAEHSTFEETVYLLWHGKLPTRAQLDELERNLKAHRALPAPLADILRQLPKEATPMAVLRTAVSALAAFYRDSDAITHDALVRHATILTACLPTIVAAWHRLRQGQPLLEPRDDLSHAANFLYMLNGAAPNERAARVLDIALILHADHGLNASTFAARVTASTLADMFSAITSALGALKGPLHGGANEQVMRMLESIGSVERVKEWIDQALSQKKKIMGFGHRVYRQDDPRALILRRISKEVGEANNDPHWYQLSEAIENYMGEVKPGLPINVDFYSASTYHVLGVPTDLFTPIFAISRVAGWTAHVIEQIANNRLIRPDALYVGPLNVPYVPIEQRG